LPNCRELARGLRHTVAVILRELGQDDRSIADALGQKKPEMALLYAEGDDLKRKIRGVVRNFDAEVNRRRTNAVKPTKKSVKPHGPTDESYGKLRIETYA
jgi:hypothetical protein